MLCALDDDDTFAKVRGLYGGFFASRTTANHDQIESLCGSHENRSPRALCASINAGALDVLHVPHGDDDGLAVDHGVVWRIDYQLHGIFHGWTFQAQNEKVVTSFQIEVVQCTPRPGRRWFYFDLFHAQSLALLF